MKKLLFTLFSLFLTLNLYARNENINIDNPKTYAKVIGDQLSDFKSKYKLSINVNITIDEDGSLSYQILNESDVEDFQKQLEDFLDEQARKKFPTLNNQSYTTTITFIPQDLNISNTNFHHQQNQIQNQKDMPYNNNYNKFRR